jgi:hypothetical protein
MLDDVFLQQRDVNDVDIIQHRFSIETAEDDDLVSAIGICRMSLSSIHEIETLGACIVDWQIPVFLLKIEANELITSHFTVVTSEDVQTIAEAVSAVAS